MTNQINLWNEYARGEKIMLAEEMAEEIISTHSQMFEKYSHYGFACINVKVNDLPSNLFIINNKEYGACCEKCGSSIVFLLIQPVREIEDPECVIWVPCLEDVGSLMTGQPPVAIECNKDYSLKSSCKWRCLKCAGWNEIRYDSRFGLMY